MTLETAQKLQGQLGNITRGYGSFVSQLGLEDTHLTRMTYFSACKKDYVENPMADKDEQAIILNHLDAWMERTEKAMNDAMPPPPQSLVLAVATKR